MQKNELLSIIPNYLKNDTENKKTFSEKELIEFILSFAFEEESEEASEIIYRKIFKEGGFLSKNPHQIFEKNFDEKLFAFVKAILEFSKKLSEISSSERHLYYFTAAGKFVQNFIGLNETEGFYLICLSEDNFVISAERIAEGDLGSVFIDVDSVISKAKEYEAKNVIVAHNHTSHYIRFSMEDFHSTEKLRSYFLKENINLIEHFVVNKYGYKGIYKELFGVDRWKTPEKLLSML